MSWKVQEYILPFQMKPNEKLVALILAWHANDYGNDAYPSISTICHETCLSRASVQRSLKGLIAGGVISLERRSGQHHANHYRFLLPLGFPHARGITQQPLAPEVSNESQRYHTDSPEVSHRGPNSKEQSLEKGDFAVVEKVTGRGRLLDKAPNLRSDSGN